MFSHAFMELATRGKLLLAAPHVIPPRVKGGEGDPLLVLSVCIPFGRQVMKEWPSWACINAAYV